MLPLPGVEDDDVEEYTSAARCRGTAGTRNQRAQEVSSGGGATRAETRAGQIWRARARWLERLKAWDSIVNENHHERGNARHGRSERRARAPQWQDSSAEERQRKEN